VHCPKCRSTAVKERPERTAQGYRRFRCLDCTKQFNERSSGLLNRTRYPSDVIALVVLWRLRYKLSLRDLAEMFLIRPRRSRPPSRPSSGRGVSRVGQCITFAPEPNIDPLQGRYRIVLVGTSGLLPGSTLSADRGSSTRAETQTAWRHPYLASTPYCPTTPIAQRGAVLGRVRGTARREQCKGAKAGPSARDPEAAVDQDEYDRRNHAMAAPVAAGVPKCRVGAEFGLSAERIRQIVLDFAARPKHLPERQNKCYLAVSGPAVSGVLRDTCAVFLSNA
jgi:hypothetical protein